jgi:predicted RecA/RadA family phage recombinase
MKNLIRQKANNLPLIAPFALTSGAPFMVGSIFAVASNDAAIGAAVEGVTTGEYSLPKTTGEAWTQGIKLYWNATTKLLTTTASGNTQVAVATQGAASAATTGAAKLVYVA